MAVCTASTPWGPASHPNPTPRPLGPACIARAQILKLLSEEVFDFSRDEMTSAKAKKLKESFNNDFSLIFQLCEFIMGNSTKSTLHDHG